MCKFFKTNVLFKYYMLAAFHIIPYYFSKIKLFLGKLKKKKKTSASNEGVVGSIPGRGARIPYASWPEGKNKT